MGTSATSHGSNVIAPMIPIAHAPAIEVTARATRTELGIPVRSGRPRNSSSAWAPIPTASAKASTAAPSLPHAPRNGRTLVFAGRLVPQKALSVAFEAVRRNGDVTLLVAGDGPERAKIEAGAPPNVRFLGAQPRERVFELMHAADATLLSSDWESFGLVVAESLAVGTPVLAASAGGVGEVLEDGRNGLLVRAGDVDGLAAAIQRFFADEGLRERLREAAADSVRRLAPDEIYPRYEAILEETAR